MVYSHGHFPPGFHQRGIKGHYNEQHMMFEDTVRFTLYYMCTLYTELIPLFGAAHNVVFIVLFQFAII